MAILGVYETFGSTGMTPDRAGQILQLLEGITSELDSVYASPDRLDEILSDLKAIDAERTLVSSSVTAGSGGKGTGTIE
jgi:hypothetical protein